MLVASRGKLDDNELASQSSRISMSENQNGKWLISHFNKLHLLTSSRQGMTEIKTHSFKFAKHTMYFG